MSSKLKNISIYRHANDTDILSDPKYICSASTLITEALKNGSDVMQLSNGEIIITEYRAVTINYKWNHFKNKFTKASYPTERNKALDKTLDKAIV
jgi:hypothetical protein